MEVKKSQSTIILYSQQKTELIQPLALYFVEIWGKWTKWLRLISREQSSVM
jgi:hypothetical protein